MARFAVIESGRVVNIIEAISADDLPSMTLVPAYAGVVAGWTWNGATFAPPPRWPSVGAGRADLRADIKRIRNRIEQTGFAYMGKQIECDQISAQRLAGAAQLAMIAAMAGQPFSIDWTCADDSTLTMDGPQMLGAMAAMGAHVQALHVRARELKAQVIAATTLADLQAVDISAGWPA